jgi:prolyl oligopeptidase
MRATIFVLLVLLGAMFSGANALTTDVSLGDPYAWLEDVHGAKPLAWVAEQNEKSLGPLKADPRYAKNYDSILSVLDATDRIPFGSLDHGFVYNFWQDAQNPKGLWRRTTVADYQNAAPHWQLLLDVDALAKAEKENWVFSGAECAPGQKRCLIRLSRGGGDAVVVREYDLAAMKLAADGFSLPEAKSDATYLDDDTVLFATAADGATASSYARIVKQWRRGTPVSAARTLYEGEKTDVGVSASAFHSDHGHFAVIVRSVGFFETDYFVLEKDGVKQLPLPRSASLHGVQIGELTHMLVTLRQDWTQDGKTFQKGALVSLTLDPFLKTGKDPFVQALYTPDARGAVEQVAISGNTVFAAITENVIGAIRQFSWGDVDGDQWVQGDIALPRGGSVGIISTDDYETGKTNAYFTYQGYLTPPTLYAFNSSRSGGPEPIKSLPARFDASGLVTEQFEATSKDGTKVPYFVTRPKNLSGPAPTLLYGYGGFEVSLTPSYSANFGRLWLSHGGIYVVANIRGGGEFGPAWHEAALKLNRQRAFDDFAAVAADLEARGLTTPKQLGIMGGSNGGLLVSTVMTQIPEKLGAVVCQVPLIDMIAYPHIGAGASWEGEYGDPADPKMRDYILTYSPYQNVKAGVKYPPVFFVTATSDDRVTPVHARKMAAKMQAQGHDVLFYENTDGGHAAAADHKQAAEMWALSFVYLAEKLGLKEEAP